MNHALNMVNFTVQDKSTNIHKTDTPLELRDLWATPQFVFDFADKNIVHGGFALDGAANSYNTKCELYITEDQNSLGIDWSELLNDNPNNNVWVNPPYSNISPWLTHAYEQSLNGVTTVLLIPTPNGESYYGEYVFDLASELIFIDGRLSFVAAGDFTIPERINRKGQIVPEKHIKKGDTHGGNPRGSCFVVFRPNPFNKQILYSHIDRDVMKN